MQWPTPSNFVLWLLERLKPGDMHKLLCMAAFIGFLGALTTLAFRECIEWGEYLLFGTHDDLIEAANALPLWMRFLIPTLGGIIAGYVLQWSSRCQSSNAATDYMEAISIKDGSLNVKQSLYRAFSSILSIVSGSSVGREASMVQLSAMTALVFGKWSTLSALDRRLLVACGGAAGITAAYNAPIAGALFISEIVFKSIAAQSLGPLLVASVVSDLTIHAFLGHKPVYEMPTFTMVYDAEVLLHGGVGIFAGFAAPFFLKSIHITRLWFRGLPWGFPFKLGVGGAIVGAISLLHPEVWGNGYGVANQILAGQWIWQALVIVMLCKFGATVAAVGSGTVGGIFTPSLFMGAALGFLFGEGMHIVWPSLAPSPMYAATGMAAFLAATTHAPLMAILMIFEMTGNYKVMLPAMLASVMAYSIASRVNQRSVYADSLKPEKTATNFSTMSVKEVMHTDPPTVRCDASLQEFERRYVSSRWQNVYVVDDDNHFLGAVSLHDIRPVLQKPSQLSSQLPPQFLRKDYPRVSEKSSLGRALEVFAGHSGERIPVVNDERKLLGYIAKTDLMLLLQESYV